MTKDMIDEACRRFISSDLTPEEFHNQLVDEKFFNPTIEESRLLIELFYGLRRVDERILSYASKMEGLI